MSNTLKKASIIGVAVATAIWLSGAAFIVPVANAQSVADLQAQINALLAQITALQAQLVAVGGGSAACSFTQDLTEGVSGADVTCLQTYLTGTGHFTFAGGATGFFGSVTKAAVAAWQAANGVSPAVGYFGPVSRAKYSSVSVAVSTTTTTTTTTVPTTVTTVGAEGSVTAKYAPSPITGLDYAANSTDQQIVGVELKATGSDVVVNRVDLKFDTRPWLNIARIHILDGSTKVASMDVTSSNTIETTVGSNYTVRVSGLNVLVQKDQTKTLYVAVDPILVAGDTTKTITYKVLANGIRATDGAGLTQNAPLGDLAARTFVSKTSSVASLEVSENDANPNVASNLLLSTTATTEGVTALVFDVKAKTNAAYVRTLKVAATYASNSAAVLKLYDGSMLLKSVSAAEPTTFDDLSVFISKDSTKTFTVKVDVPKSPGGQNDTTADASASLTVNATNVVGEDATTYGALAVTGSNVSNGGTYYWTNAVPVLSLVGSPSITAKKGSGDNSNTFLADFKIRVNVTASGGDIYVASIDGLKATSNSGSIKINAQTFSSDATAQASSNWKVSNGSTRYFEVSGEVENLQASSQVAGMIVQTLNWNETDAGAYNAQTWGFTNFKTGNAILQAKN